jgi:hypothetical protein
MTSLFSCYIFAIVRSRSTCDIKTCNVWFFSNGCTCSSYEVVSCCFKCKRRLLIIQLKIKVTFSSYAWGPTCEDLNNSEFFTANGS